MKFAVVLFLGAAVACLASDGRAAAYARAVQEAGLDADACYRVRDLAFQKEDLRFYLNDGYLIFSRPVEGRRFGAVFSAHLPGSDGEVLLFPPHRSERMSLAAFAKTPNLNEHFSAALFLFTDNTAAELLDQIQQGEPRKEPEVGTDLASRYTDTLRNLAASYEVRLVQDQFSGRRKDTAFFYGALHGRQLGNIDVLFDARQRDSILVGQLVFRETRAFFDTWTSFAARSFRTGRRRPPESTASVKNVKIEASLGADLHMRAKTTISLVAETDGEGAVEFELSRRMRVTEAKLDGEPVEVFARESMRANLIRGGENEVFLAILPTALKQGEAHTLEISHEGSVVTSAGEGVYFVGSRTSWYPVRTAEFAPYELVFTHPASLNLVATGELVDERTEGETRIARHTTSTPIRFAGFNLGEYDKISTVRSGVTIDVCANRKVESALQPRAREVVVLPPPPPFAGRRGRRNDVVALPAPAPPPPSPTARLQNLSAEIASALEFMAEHFGPPPLKTLTVSPIPGAFGQGFPGLLYLSTLAYLDPADRPASAQSQYQRTFFSELLLAHETAHQWWGNLVTSGNYQDDWLMEALASYSALMVLEKRKGRRFLESALDEYRNNLEARQPDGRTVESSGPIVWGIRLHSSQSPGAWRTIMYEKGSWILHMLRMKLGDAPFLKLLGELTKRKRFKAVTTEEFRQLAAEFVTAGADDPKLEEFFDQWVYDTGVPTLKLAYTVQGKAPKVTVRGTLTQSDVPDEFSVRVPVQIQLPGKEAVTHWLRTSDEPVSFAVALKQAPLRVALDPANTVLARK